MNDEEDEPVVPVLCDKCSNKLTSGENWLGAMPLDNAFECMICHSLCCAHLLGGNKVCQGCAS